MPGGTEYQERLADYNYSMQYIFVFIFKSKENKNIFFATNFGIIYTLNKNGGNY